MDSSYENTSSWIARSTASCWVSCNLWSSLKNWMFSISTSKSISSRKGSILGTCCPTSFWELGLFIFTWSLCDFSNFPCGGFLSPPSPKLFVEDFLCCDIADWKLCLCSPLFCEIMGDWAPFRLILFPSSCIGLLYLQLFQYHLFFSQ